ncbi:SRP40, C-terminal domain-containing protein [Hyaloraphidium curvatum]|nr:SRP40, C-terminal domain-containing protein [Hyaloraphidium curvatum]
MGKKLSAEKAKLLSFIYGYLAGEGGLPKTAASLLAEAKLPILAKSQATDDSDSSDSDGSSSSSEDEKLAPKKAAPVAKTMNAIPYDYGATKATSATKPKAAQAEADSESSEDEAPAPKPKKAVAPKPKAVAAAAADSSSSSSSESDSSSDSESSEDEAPAVTKAAAEAKASVKKAGAAAAPQDDSSSSSSSDTSDSDSSEDERPAAKPANGASASKAGNGVATGGAKRQRSSSSSSSSESSSSDSSSDSSSESESEKKAKKAPPPAKKHKKDEDAGKVTPAGTKQASNSGSANGNASSKKGTPFQRVDPTTVEFVDERLKDNSFLAAKKASTNDFGYKAHLDLIVTRGKGFRQEKTKKKRGSYRGGSIDFESNSIKFDDDDE